MREVWTKRLACLGILTGMGAAAGACLANTTIYLSPGGNDAWSGTLAAPNAQKSDGPLATPAKARDVARAAKREQGGQAVDVVLRGGTYFLADPLVLTSEDSGTDAAALTWSAAPGETPVISAGRKIDGWQKTTVNGRDAFVAKLPAEGAGSYAFRELWVNGARAQRARWPKRGSLATAPTPKAKTHADWRRPESQFSFCGEDLKAWPTAADGEAVVMSRWVEARLPITKIDAEQHLVQSSKLAGFTSETDDRYYVENIKECLTHPGEFYLDAREHAVYLIPPAGVADPNAAEVIAPVHAQVLRLLGDPAGKRFVEHVTFRGLTFAHSEWYYDHVPPGQNAEPTRTSYAQASVGVPGAVWGDGVRHCTFDRCTIAHLGGYGIELGRGCQNDRITRCTIADLGAGGVKIGEPSVSTNADAQAFGNEISDCTITDGGNVFPSAVGVWIGQSHDNALVHCEIARFWYTGVSVGWTWGYGKALSQNNHIERNHIHHIGIKRDDDEPILSDMGGIYTLGDQKGSTVRFNHFHDIAAHHYGGWGIYFDEGTTDILAENNLVNRTTHGGFHQHYGKDNVFRNNIIAFGRDAQIQRTRPESHRSFTFERNIVLWDHGNLLAGNWDKFNVDFDHNTYWRIDGDESFKFGKYTLEQWRDAGLDQHSKVADPHFKDAEHGDFSATEASSAAYAGFVPFDLSDVGPR